MQCLHRADCRSRTRYVGLWFGPKQRLGDVCYSAAVRGFQVRVLASSTETISDATDRVDQRIGLLVVDLATQAPDIDVDNICRGIEMHVPDVLQQHGAGDDAAF